MQERPSILTAFLIFNLPDMKKSVLLFLLVAPLISLGQKRAELTKCIKTYRSQYIKDLSLQTTEAKLKKQIATYMILDGYDFMTQTDSSITFSRYNEWGQEVYVEPTWEDAIFFDPYDYFNQTKLGLVNITVGWYYKEDGLDIWAESNFRSTAHSEPRTCVMFDLYGPLRNFLFRKLDSRKPDWPEELLIAIDQYNADRENPGRRINPNYIY